MSRLPTRLPLSDPAGLIATACGVGFLPAAPGTFGALIALPIAWGAYALLGSWAVAALGALAFTAGVWAAGRYIQATGIEDPSAVVIDEVAAQLFVLALAPPDLGFYVLGFVFFRIFDIAKPFPVSWADRRIKGGIGAMVDDLLAAIYAGAAMLITQWLLPGA
ncbi:MAG: phosphatidylglycerophosphatase A [Alphaproteobacteria bacterium]